MSNYDIISAIGISMPLASLIEMGAGDAETAGKEH
jgi:hypothetical protein